MVSCLSLEAMNSLRVVTVTLRASRSAWPPWSKLGQGYKPYRALWLGQGEDEGAGEWAAPFKERAVGKELWEPAGHLFLNDRGSQELWAPPSSIHPAPITFLSLSGYLEPPAR